MSFDNYNLEEEHDTIFQGQSENIRVPDIEDLSVNEVEEDRPLEQFVPEDLQESLMF